MNRRRALASSAVFSTSLTALTALAGFLGSVPWAIALGFLSAAGWAVTGLAVAWGRPRWTPAEKAVLRGAIRAEALFEAVPGREGLR